LEWAGEVTECVVAGICEDGQYEIGAESLPALQHYMRWHALHAAAPYLSKQFVDESFAFFNQTLNGRRSSSRAGSAAHG